MLKVFRFTLLSLIITTSLFTNSCSPGFSSHNEKPAPDFSLKTLDGQTVTLNQFRGKPVLLNFWASWCQPCREEMPFLQQTYDKFKEKGLVFFAVDIGENPETINKFFLDYSLSMPVLLDSEKSVGQDYGITGIPETFLIDKSGIIRKWQIGAYPNTKALEDDLKFIMP